MPTRRDFLGAISFPAAYIAAAGSGVLLRPERAEAAWSPRLAELLSHEHASLDDAANDEDFWSLVGQAFTQDRSVVNLNNGGCSPAPRVVQEAHKRHLDYANQMPPPYALWQVQDKQLVGVKEKLAAAFGGSVEELAITRNSSESLETCLFGHDLKPGDEVLTTTVDYPRMITTLKQRERREGIVLKQIKLPIPCEDPALIVKLFRDGITERTKLILCCHIVNITGQILPVRDIVRMARTARPKDPIPVVIDGAHALAHFDFRLEDLDCDYYGVSLHKWLFAPHGTGLLYVRKDKIKGLWPLMAADAESDEKIGKFEAVGTHPAAPYLAIAEAVEFHTMLGAARKEARLVHLRDIWAMRLKSHPSGRVRLHTSLRPPDSGDRAPTAVGGGRQPAAGDTRERWNQVRYAAGIATVQVEGLDSGKLSGHIWDKHRILTTAIKHDEFEGIRVTPSVYTSLNDLDRFCAAVEDAIENGLPTT